MIRGFSGNEALNYTQNEWRSRLVLALSEGRQWGATQLDKEMEERIEVAIASLTMAMVEDIEQCYSPSKFKVDATIQKSFTVEAPNAQDAKLQVVQSVHDNNGTVSAIQAKPVLEEAK